MKTSLALMIVSMVIVIDMYNTGAAVAAADETYNLLCKQATIDAIAYADVQKMFWISSGSHYWYFTCNTFRQTECTFPNGVSDSAAKPLPPEMPAVDAAVYVDAQTTCHKSQQTTNGNGINVNEHRIWTVRLANGMHRLLPMEAMGGGWTISKLQNYSQEHCISKADIQWTSGRPVNAMFAVNNLYLYFLMGDRLAMVDCSYICTDHIDGKGTGKPWIPVKDWLQTDEQVYSMFTINSFELYVFFKDYYLVYTIDTKTVDANGYVTVRKRDDKRDIHKDFLRIDNPVDCPTTTTTSMSTELSNSSNDKTDGHTQSVADSKDDDSDGRVVWLWIVIVVIVVVLAVVCCLVCLISRRRSKSGDNKHKDSAAAVAEAIKTPKQSPKPSAKISPAARKHRR